MYSLIFSSENRCKVGISSYNICNFSLLSIRAGVERSIHLISLIVLTSGHFFISIQLLSHFEAVSLGKIKGWDWFKVHITFIEEFGKVFDPNFVSILYFISCKNILSSLRMTHVWICSIKMYIFSFICLGQRAFFWFGLLIGLCVSYYRNLPWSWWNWVQLWTHSTFCCWFTVLPWFFSFKLCLYPL